MNLKKAQKFILKMNFFCLIFFVLSAFKESDYAIFVKKINDNNFFFAVPNTFCENKDNSDELSVEFVKCYELDLQKEQSLEFFSEFIIFSFEKEDSRIQNITNERFSEIRKNVYQEMIDKEVNKDNRKDYNENKNYAKNTKIVMFKKQHIFESKSKNEDGNQQIFYESETFLNKRYVKINWLQFLYKNEKLLNRKKFYDLIKENIFINNYKDILYSFPARKIIIPLPKLPDFINYTDIKTINTFNLHAYFANIFSKPEEQVIIRVSILNFEENIFNIFKEYENLKDKKILKLKLIKYKDENFIKITMKDYILYENYINLKNNFSLHISLTLRRDEKSEKNALKNIYNYRQDLINKNL